jgi:hypothetical protein
MQKPTLEEHAPYFSLYIDKVPDIDIINALEKQIDSFSNLLRSITEEKSLHRYAPEKWSIKELTVHILDTERIMAYRALCISRNEKNSLPGFDQDEYAREIDYRKITMNGLLEEFTVLRKSNILMFKNFTEEMCSRKGLANQKPISVCALAYVIYGHAQHHLNILQEKYL